jgi:hypothetical protein
LIAEEEEGMKEKRKVEALLDTLTRKNLSKEGILPIVTGIIRDRSIKDFE